MVGPGAEIAGPHVTSMGEGFTCMEDDCAVPVPVGLVALLDLNKYIYHILGYICVYIYICINHILGFCYRTPTSICQSCELCAKVKMMA